MRRGIAEHRRCDDPDEQEHELVHDDAARVAHDSRLPCQHDGQQQDAGKAQKEYHAVQMPELEALAIRQQRVGESDSRHYHDERRSMVRHREGRSRHLRAHERIELAAEQMVDHAPCEHDGRQLHEHQRRRSVPLLRGGNLARAFIRVFALPDSQADRRHQGQRDGCRDDRVDIRDRDDGVDGAGQHLRQEQREEHALRR